MPERKLVGQNYTTPDLVAKVTGKARYAEDYRADGMLFCKLLLSPMPHARVRRFDASQALAMKGVVAVLTADDFPSVKPDQSGLKPEQALTNEPVYGRPVAKRFHHTKPPTILDVPVAMKWDAVNVPDPETPVGARGIGEPPVGAGYGAVLNALVEALGDDAFRRTPVTPDIIVAALDAGKWTHEALTAHV